MILRFLSLITSPFLDIFYASLRDNVYILGYGSYCSQGVGLLLFLPLLVQSGVSIDYISPILFGKKRWDDVPLFLIKKTIADMRDRGVTILVVCFDNQDCSSVFLSSVPFDALLFDPSYLSHQHSYDQTLDHRSLLDRFLNKFYTTQRGKKTVVFPKDSRILYEILTNNPCEHSISYSATTDASFRILFSDTSDEITLSMFGTSYTILMPSIPHVFRNFFVCACAGLYALSGDIGSFHSLLSSFNVSHILQCRIFSFQGVYRVWANRAIVENALQFAFPGAVYVSSSIFSREGGISFVTSCSYNDLFSSYDFLSSDRLGENVFFFSSREYALYFLKMFFLGYSWLFIDAQDPDRDQKFLFN